MTTAPTHPGSLSAELAGPVTAAERIDSIDVLRGLALLGILVMNVQSFSMPDAAYLNPSAYADLTAHNLAAFLFARLLFDQKMMTIFSILFGAGIVLMTQRRDAAGLPTAALHYRRMGWLLLFGLLHAHLIWHGDILYTYALCGMLAYLMRRWPPLVLTALSAAALTIPALYFLMMYALTPMLPPEAIAQINASWAPPPDQIAEQIAAFRGSWLDQQPYRSLWALMFQTQILITWTGWRAGGLMLFGMALYKTGVLSAARSTRFYAALIAIALLLGVPAIAEGVRRDLAAGFEMRYSFFLNFQINDWASLLVALGWIGAVMLICRHKRLPRTRAALAAVGRTALSNYLFQSIACTLIFYGHGLGLYARLDRLQQLAVVAAVWALQIALSIGWLRYFRFGPAEWLWRRLAYLRPTPLRR